MAKHDAMSIYTALDASAPTKGALQVSLVALVFQGDAKITHIVAAGGQAIAPNAELMVLEMSIVIALVAGCWR